MIKNVALAVAAIIVAGCYFYIMLQTKRIDDLSQDKLELSQQVASLKRQVIFEQNQLARSNLLYKEYVERANQIQNQVRTITIYRDVVKELPAEVVVEKANEDSNEIIDSIVLGAINFSRLHDTKTPSAGVSTNSDNSSGPTTAPGSQEAGVAVPP